MLEGRLGSGGCLAAAVSMGEKVTVVLVMEVKAMLASMVLPYEKGEHLIPRFVGFKKLGASYPHCLLIRGHNGPNGCNSHDS